MKIKTLFSTLLIFSISIFSPIKSNAISRIHDPIVIQAQQLPDLLGQAVEDVRIYVYSKSLEMWNPILFQIDELDQTGTYLGEKNSIMDPADEIVFLSNDLGDIASPVQWPENTSAHMDNRFEIRITDPLLPEESGYAYIFISKDLQKLTGSYFDVNTIEDWVKTPSYTVTFGEHGFQSGLYIHETAGGDSINIVERQKLRIIGKVLGTNDDFAILEEMDGSIKLLNGLAKIDAYVGPKSINYLQNKTIRAHRYLELEYRFKGSVLSYKINKTGTYQFLTTFYPTFSEFQSGDFEITKIDNVNIREVRMTTDLLPNAKGMLFYNPYNNPPLRIDESGDSYDDTLPWPGDNWHLIVANPSDPERTINTASILTVTEIPAVPANTTGMVYFKDSQSKVKYDTGDNESWGDTGFKMTGASITGVINFQTANYYLPENLTYSQAETLADAHLNPLQVQISSQKPMYQVVLDQNPAEGGTIALNPPDSMFEANTTITLHAMRNPGFKFTGWSGDIESMDNPLQLQLQENISITANFIPVMHRISFASNPQNLIIVVDNSPLRTPVSFLWQESTQHTVEADPYIIHLQNERLAFLSWTPENPEKFVLEVNDQDSVFIASYIKQFLLTAESSNQMKGKIVINNLNPWFNEGTTAIVKAIPAPNYRFDHWTGDTLACISELPLVMNKPWSVLAHFINAPPVILAADSSVAEDDTLFLSLSDLKKWIQDDSSPIDSLTLQFYGTDYIDAVYYDRSYELSIIPKQNWFGTDTIWVTATDPLDEATTAPLIIEVLSRPDAPSPFNLLSPENQTGISTWPHTLEFTWQQATDVDPGDTVTYIFELDSSITFQSPLKIRIENIQWMQYILLWPDYLIDDTYYWHILAQDKTGLITPSSSYYELTLATAIARQTDLIPAEYILEQNYPNPFNGSTTFRYGLPKDDHVTITIFNNQGQTVRKLWEGDQKAGYHILHWQGQDDTGRFVPSGMYMIVMHSKDRRWVKKALLLQ